MILDKKEHNEGKCWVVCKTCHGLGKRTLRLSKKERISYKKAIELYKKNEEKGLPPTRPKSKPSICKTCSGSGLESAANYPIADSKRYPNVAIIGGGIGGVALAVACLHRGIPFTIYERDGSFDSRSQGYGLTLQQAHKAISGFGIRSLKKGIRSTRHVVYTTEGKIIGEWGMRKWTSSNENKGSKRTNMHIPRQSLRQELLNQLGGCDAVQWGHQLVDCKTGVDEGLDLSFQVNGQLKRTKADLVVGADGIRSSVRRLILGEDKAPLHYLGCIVILGICPLEKLQDIKSPLLDSATVFQTANGKERIYMMPFTANSVMWQLSFPMSEAEAKSLSAEGVQALKKEACRRTQWHDPIPQVLEATLDNQISGYPVYDRALIQSGWMEQAGPITLIGDAAHPMSPFKGQGANQALLDALSLAREISKGCRPDTNWKERGVRHCVLNTFELEMLERSASKVKDSAKAAKILHSELVLDERDGPRGGSTTIKEDKTA